MIFTKEQEDLRIQFEKDFKHLCFIKVDKINWYKGIIYQDTEVNNLFLAYVKGYVLGKLVGYE